VVAGAAVGRRGSGGVLWKAEEGSKGIARFAVAAVLL